MTVTRKQNRKRGGRTIAKKIKKKKKKWKAFSVGIRNRNPQGNHFVQWESLLNCMIFRNISMVIDCLSVSVRFCCRTRMVGGSSISLESFGGISYCAYSTVRIMVSWQLKQLNRITMTEWLHENQIDVMTFIFTSWVLARGIIAGERAEKVQVEEYYHFDGWWCLLFHANDWDLCWMSNCLNSFKHGQYTSTKPFRLIFIKVTLGHFSSAQHSPCETVVIFCIWMCSCSPNHMTGIIDSETKTYGKTWNLVTSDGCFPTIPSSEFEIILVTCLIFPSNAIMQPNHDLNKTSPTHSHTHTYISITSVMPFIGKSSRRWES